MGHWVNGSQGQQFWTNQNECVRLIINRVYRDQVVTSRARHSADAVLFGYKVMGHVGHRSIEIWATLVVGDDSLPAWLVMGHATRVTQVN